MLYDKRWDKQSETKGDPFTLASLIAWLETMPSNRRYCFTHNGQCLLSQYFKFSGFKNVHMFTIGFCHGRRVPKSWTLKEATSVRRVVLLPNGFNNIAIACPRTFGAALERARAIASR